jgi:hypothetical protein
VLKVCWDSLKIFLDYVKILINLEEFGRGLWIFAGEEDVRANLAPKRNMGGKLEIDDNK